MMKALISIFVALVAAVAFAFYAQNRAASLEQTNQALLARVVELEQRLERESSQRNARASEDGLGQAEKLELMRLRNEVTQLRASSQAAADAEAENARLLAENKQLRENARADQAKPATPGLPREQWTFQGYATPQAAYTSALWALREANHDNYLASLTPEARQAFESANQGKSLQQIAAELKSSFGSISAFHVRYQEEVSPTDINLLTTLRSAQSEASQTIRMKLIGNEWKIAAPLEVRLDPMGFYRRNPELMRRYFPHLFKGEGGAQVPAQPRQ